MTTKKSGKTLELTELMCEVSFSYKVNKDDANSVTVKTTLDFSDHTAAQILERACADAVIDLQRRLRSGSASVNDRPEVKDAEGKVTQTALTGVQGKVFKVPAPGTKTRKAPEAKILDLAKKLNISEEDLAKMLAKMAGASVEGSK